MWLVNVFFLVYLYFYFSALGVRFLFHAQQAVFFLKEQLPRWISFCKEKGDNIKEYIVSLMNPIKK